jgi:hypothetical protein
MKRTLPIVRHVSQRAVPARLSQMKAALILLLLVAVPVPCVAQAIPAATASPISTGFSLPSLAGTLQYAVSSSREPTPPTTSATQASTPPPTSRVTSPTSRTAQLYPFSTVFSGGRAWSSSGQSSYNFFNLSLSQGIRAQRWTFGVSDSVNYLPANRYHRPLRRTRRWRSWRQSCRLAHEQRTPGQGVLTGFSTRVSNSSSLSARPPADGQDIAQRLRHILPHPLPQHLRQQQRTQV